MILRGQIVADCRVTSNGDADQTGYPVASCPPEIAPVPAHETNIWGNTDVDQFEFGDADRRQRLPDRTRRPPRLRHALQRRVHLPRLEDAVHGSQSAVSPGDDGEEQFVVWYLQSMNVIGAPAGLAGGATGAGHSLTLDGQAETDYYTIYTLGSHGDFRNYVINILDTGASNDGVDEAAIYGWDEDSPRSSTGTCRAR